MGNKLMGIRSKAGHWVRREFQDSTQLAAMIHKISRNYDYIIVGAGAAGAAVAGRLSEDKGLSILLIEAGRHERHPRFLLPVLTSHALKSAATRVFHTEPEPALQRRRLEWPRGVGLGGSTLVNGMLWVRGDAAEYDNWDRMGCKGWGYRDVLPFFRRSEADACGSPDTRGRDGAIQVTRRHPRDPLTDAFLSSCSSQGVPLLEDYNEGVFDGAAYLQFNLHRGLRHGADRAYLAAARRRSNLTILQGALASRVLLEGRRAVGVEFLTKQGLKQAKASREVILCCGALQTPQLLELSGIGAHDVLARQGIATVIHLPGVGENLRDHLNTRLGFKSTFNGTLNQVQHHFRWRARAAWSWLRHRGGPLSMVGATAHALLRTRPCLARPDAKVQLLHYSADPTNGNLVTALDTESGFSISNFVLRPQSTGSCHIASKDFTVPPAVRANYLTHPEDVITTVHALRMIYKLVRSQALSPWVRADAQEDMSEASDETLLQWVRDTGASSYHPIGTCKMGVDSMSVVGPHLRVHGVDGLRIADASIMPTMPSSNTQAPCVMIGEKLAYLLMSG